MRPRAGLAFLTLINLCFGCAPRPELPDHNLILITVDTLRADHVSAYGHERPTTPAIDALAAAGVRFADTIAPRGQTWPALATILTGVHPRTHGVRDNGMELARSHVTLAELLQDVGYSTAAFLTNMTTAPHPGFDELALWEEVTANPLPQYERDREATAAAIRWLRDHSDERFFLWLHLVGPHDPYTLVPDLPRRYATAYEGDLMATRSALVKIHRARRQLDPKELAHLVSLYDEEVTTVDARVGELLAALDASGARDTTLTALVADHGDELYDHDAYFLHSLSISRSVLRTPFVLRLPGVLPPGHVVSELVQHADIAPTLLSILGLPIPEEMEGLDIAALARAEGPHPHTTPAAFSELGPKIHAIQTRRWKYVHNPERLTAPGAQGKNSGYLGFFHIAVDELYDLDADPGEKINVAEEHPKLVAALRERLQTFFEASDAPPITGISPESRRELQALGYLE